MILQQSSELPFCCTNRSLDIGLLHGIHSQSDLVRPKYVNYIECCIRLSLFQQYKMENCQLPVKVPLVLWLLLLLLSVIMMSQHTVSRILFKCNSSKDDLSFATNIISFFSFFRSSRLEDADLLLPAHEEDGTGGRIGLHPHHRDNLSVLHQLGCILGEEVHPQREPLISGI